jgi:hypothetical protein
VPGVDGPERLARVAEAVVEGVRLEKHLILRVFHFFAFFWGFLGFFFFFRFLVYFLLILLI